jgi:hypothetical protein
MMIIRRLHNLAKESAKAGALCGLAVVALLLIGCSENQSSVQHHVDGSTKLSLSAPGFISERAALDINTLQPIVEINGTTIEVTKSGSNWVGSTTVAEGSAVSLKVEWYEQFENQSLLLARAVDGLDVVSTNVSFVLDDDSYVTSSDASSPDPLEFDADGDSIANLIERNQDTNPRDANSPSVSGGEQAQVKVPATSRTDNVIDGLYNSAYWNNAQGNNINNETLLIRNLIVDEVGDYVDGSTQYQWLAIHDEEFLTIYVLAKPGLSPNHGDSGEQYFNDDTLEIFWDGDLSRSNGYDTVDDMQLLIPLLRDDGTPNESGAANTRIQRGANVKAEVPFDVANVEFATCLCAAPGERIGWEIKINLEEAGIPVGQTFGFEIQIDQDDDGGNRDAKWAWFSPSATEGQTKDESDQTWRYPSVMGTMQLLPFPSL